MRGARLGEDEALSSREHCVKPEEAAHDSVGDQYLGCASASRQSGGLSVELIKLSGATRRKSSVSIRKPLGGQRD